MTRLPRSRGGKTAIDVTLTAQAGLMRVRLTMGEDNSSKKNTDMDELETANLITILEYKLAELRGEL